MRLAYNAAMIPASQVLRTPRWAFVASMLGAWLVTTYSLCHDLWTTTDVSRIFDGVTVPFHLTAELGLWTTTDVSRIFDGVTVPFHLTAELGGGAAAGALLALCSGAQLSRQYCWLFSLVGVVFAMASAVMVLITVDYAFDDPLRVTKWMRSGSMVIALLIGTYLAAIVLGILTTLGRCGMSRRSARGAMVGCAIGILVFVVQGVLMRRIRQGDPIDFAQVHAMLLMAFSSIVGCAALGAVMKAERPRGARFMVLPLASVPE